MAQFQTQIPSNTVIIDVETYNDLLKYRMRVENTLEVLRTSDFLSKEDMFRSLGDVKSAERLRIERIAEREKLLEKLKEGGSNENE